MSCTWGEQATGRDEIELTLSVAGGPDPQKGLPPPHGETLT